MTLDSLPSYTYCTQCKKRPDPLPLLDRPLVDPETGETPPLTPRQRLSITQAYDAARSTMLDQFIDAARLSSEKRRAYLYGEWDEYEQDLAAHLEPDDAA